MHKKHPRPVVPVHKHLGPKQQQGQQQQGEQRKQPNKQQQQQQGKWQQGSNAGSGPAHTKHKSNHANQHAVANGYMKQQRQQQPQQQQHKAQAQQQHKQDKTNKQQQVQPKQQRETPNKAVQAQQQPPQQAQAVAPPPQQQQQRSQQQPHKRSKKRKRGDAGPAPPAAAGATLTPAAGAAGDGPAPKAAAAAAAAAKPLQPGSNAAISSNWQALQQQLKAAKEAAAAAGQHKPFRRKRKDTDDGHNDSSKGGSSSKAAKRQIGSLGRNTALTHVVAMDCEMVGVGPNGDRDSLARVSIVNAAGNVLLDTFVAQKEAVTDFRTWVSGVTPQHLIGAPSIEEVQKQVCELLSGRVVVGHSLNKDLKVLLLSHPRKDIRDTAKYPPFMFSKGGKRRPKALKQLAQQELGVTIQEGQHSSVDDARAALYLYQKHAADWERVLKTPGGLKRLPASNQVARKKRVESYGAKAITDDPMADL